MPSNIFQPSVMFNVQASSLPKSKACGRCHSRVGSGLTQKTGNTKGGSITVPLNSCLTGLELSVL